MSIANVKPVIIAGSGRGLFFAEVLGTVLHYPVAALVDINQEIHEKLKVRLAEYGLKDTAIFSTLEEAIAACPEADRVMIVTPNRTHAALLETALKAGKHVLLEKPVASFAEDVDKIEQLYAQTDKVVQLGFVLRYSSFYRRVVELIEQGAIGQVLMIQMNERLSALHGSCYRRQWRRLIANTGGFMNEKCSHDLDLMCWFKAKQAKPVSVFSVGGRHLFQRPAPSDSCKNCAESNCPYRAQDARIFGQQYQQHIDVDSEYKCVYATDADVLNHQHVTVQFSDGSHGHLSLIATSAREERDLFIHGTKGCLEGQLETGKIQLTTYGMENTTEDCSVKLSDMHGGGDQLLLEEFYDCIDRNISPSASLADGILATRIAFAADRSVEEGIPIKL